MVAKILTKAAQEAKDIWDSYNKKGGKNYSKKFEDNKPPKSKAEKGLTISQEKKLRAEKKALKKRDPEKYRSSIDKDGQTLSGLTRKKLKPEQGPYKSQGKLYSNQRNDKKTRELEKKLSEGRQKYSDKMGKASRGEGSYKDGGTPKKSLKQKIKELRTKQLTPDQERKLKESAKTDRRIVKEDTPPKPRSKPNMNKGGLVLKVLKKGVVRGSYS